jgi:serine/threonine protein kinase
MSEQPVGTEIAGYRIESVIGRGGMAVVYRAEDTRLGRKVALKLLTPALSDQEQFKQRFVQESRLAASLDHPNIIPIYEAGNADGLLFIVMRYVVGSDLKVALGGDTPLSAARTLRLFEQIGDALDAAHALGLVHRDVKPGNVLLTSVHEQADHVYLTDFGLTKRASSLTGGLTGTGHFLGTIDYVAPEQIAGRPVEARTDIYALGCVLYECFTGQVPFHRDDDAATLWAHLTEPAPPVTAVRPDLPPAVDAVVSRAMGKAPEERYDSCHDMVQALKHALEIAVPASGSRLRSGLDAGLASGRIDREDDQQTHIPSEVPDAPSHPSFPPGARDFPFRAGQSADWDEDSEPEQDVSDEGDYPALASAEYDDADADWAPQHDRDYGTTPLGPRSGRRRRWWLVAAGAAVLVLAVAGVLILMPSKHPSSLSRHYASGQQFVSVVAPFSLDTPADWTPKSGTGVEVALSPRVDPMGGLFFQVGSAGSWDPVRSVLSTNRAQAAGLWVSASNDTYDRSSSDSLQKAIKGLLPSAVSFASGYHGRPVGGMDSDEMEGQFDDPADNTASLHFVVDVVRSRSLTNPASVLLVFFAAPDKFNSQRPLFDRIRNSIIFQPS